MNKTVAIKVCAEHSALDVSVCLRMDALGQTKLELSFVLDSECRVAERSAHGREAVALAGEFRQGR
jgi:hypothetical protein